jgi:hypothetical protein
MKNTTFLKKRAAALCTIEALLRLADPAHNGTKSECANARAKAEVLAAKYDFVINGFVIELEYELEPEPEPPSEPEREPEPSYWEYETWRVPTKYCSLCGQEKYWSEFIGHNWCWDCRHKQFMDKNRFWETCRFYTY